MNRNEGQGTEYLNVDLDVIARHDLQPFVAALGRAVTVLYVGPHLGRDYLASLEVAGVTKSPEKTITRLVSLIRGLRPDIRRLWKNATVRDLDVGIQAGRDAGTFRLPLSSTILRAAADIDARLVVTVYGAGVRDLPVRRPTRPLQRTVKLHPAGRSRARS